MSTDNAFHINAICCIFACNTFIFIIGRNFGVGTIEHITNARTVDPRPPYRHRWGHSSFLNRLNWHFEASLFLSLTFYFLYLKFSSGPGHRLSIKMPSYQYRDSHVKDKSYL